MTQLILLSGWGIDARIWRPLAPYWPVHLRVSTPDWPGYSRREALAAPDDLASLAVAMRDELPASSVWVGWSLGALLAAALLDHLPAPRGLIMLGMGPCFTATGGGVSARELARFQQAFRRDPLRAWHHFLRWQLRGEPAPRAMLRRLHDLLGHRPAADSATLAAGLAQLTHLDVSGVLSRAPCPIQRLAGSADPFLADATQAASLPARQATLEGAGHCPHVSMPAHLAQTLATHATSLPASCQEAMHD
ncbi:pimeloyl-ACP methyl ester esterase BioH [Halomonas shantousis]